MGQTIMHTLLRIHFLALYNQKPGSLWCILIQKNTCFGNKELNFLQEDETCLFTNTTFSFEGLNKALNQALNLSNCWFLNNIFLT
jgi:hypothetical protein